MTGQFGTAFIERVTVPENSDTTFFQALNTLRDLRSDTSTYLIAVRRINDQSPEPNNYELGSCQYYIGYNGYGAYGERYFNSSWVPLTSINNNINGVLTPGSTFELIQFRLNKEAT